MNPYKKIIRDKVKDVNANLPNIRLKKIRKDLLDLEQKIKPWRRYTVKPK